MILSEKRVIYDTSGNPTEIRYYENDLLIARLGVILDETGNSIGLRELDITTIVPPSWLRRIEIFFGKTAKKSIDITTIDFIGNINWINTIKTINTIKKIETITKIDNIGSTGTATFMRPLWYENARNPLQVMKYFSAHPNAASAIAPHSSTSRWTYTVPSGKKAYVELVDVLIMRTEAASAADTVWVLVNHTAFTGGVAGLISTEFISNTVGASATKTLSQSVLMLTGDTLTAFTADMSTGGKCVYAVTCKITEFDA